MLSPLTSCGWYCLEEWHVRGDFGIFEYSRLRADIFGLRRWRCALGFVVRVCSALVCVVGVLGGGDGRKASVYVKFCVFLCV